MTEQPLTPQPADIAAALGHTTTDTTDSYALPALVVACPDCGSAPGALCTSHSGTRVRRNNVHQGRTKAYNARQAEDAQPRTAPDPAVTISFILDRLDRGKTLTGTELRTLRSCVTGMQAPAHLRRAAERLRREHAAVYADAGRHTADGVLRAADLLDDWATATDGE
ncbi:hypothetical protein [Streptomyces sp. NPDC020983]|uniref:zinc finger domain-containing protein n=1 Tax=Streptomyces sp. NPDC020983 TaxID=3365106 RepID=UPI0037BBE623